MKPVQTYPKMSLRLDSLRLRRAIRDKYAWPGGYPLVFITSDGAALCADCCRANYRSIAWSRLNRVDDGWLVDAIDNGSNSDEHTPCEHCGVELSAYYERDASPK